MKVKIEVLVCAPCAYLITYGEYVDGTSFAEDAFAHAESTFEAGDLANLVVGDEVEGYAPIYTCGFCGQEQEGSGQHAAAVLEDD